MSGAQLAVVLEQVAFQDPHSCRKLDACAHSTGRVLIYPLCPFIADSSGLIYLLCPIIADSSGHSCASQAFATQATTGTEASFATSVVQAQVHAMDLRGQVQEPPPAKEWWQREAYRFKYPDAPSGQQGRGFDFNALLMEWSAKHVDAYCKLYCSKERYIESDSNDSQHSLSPSAITTDSQARR